MKVIPSCSLCNHFDPDKEKCSVLEINIKGINQSQPMKCISEKRYVRNLNVLLDSYHLYEKDVQVPNTFKVDFSRLSVDKEGVPLFVITKRGIERAIPAYNGLELKGDMLLGVPKVMTYQGQRELINDLGIALATQVAASRGIELMVLESEEGSKGKPEEIERHLVYSRPNSPTSVWSKTDGEDW